MNTFFRYTSQTIRFCLYALMMTIPIGNAPVELFSNIAIGVLLIEWVVKGVLFVLNDSRKIPFQKILHPVYLAVIFYVFWNVLSAIFSTNMGQSMDAVYNKMLEGVLLFCCCLFHMRKRKHFMRLCSMFFIGAFIASIDGVFQWLTGRDFIRGYELEEKWVRLNAAFKHANGFGGYLIMVLCVLFPFIFMPIPQETHNEEKNMVKRIVEFFSPRSKIFIYVLFILCLVVLIGTFSRGAWLVFFAGFLFFSLKSRKTALIMVPFLIIFTVISSVLFFSQRDIGKFVRDEFMSRQAIQGLLSNSLEYSKRVFKETGSGRDKLWNDALQVARDYPFVGSGLNTYSDVIKTYQTAKQGFYVHNCYLQMAVEIGFIGLGSFILVLITFFYMFFVCVRKITDDFFQLLAWGMSSGVTALCAHAFFDTIFYAVQLGLLHWIFMGLVLAILKTQSEMSQCEETQRERTVKFRETTTSSTSNSQKGL